MSSSQRSMNKWDQPAPTGFGGFSFGTPKTLTFGTVTLTPSIKSNQSNNTSKEFDSLPKESESKNRKSSSQNSLNKSDQPAPTVFGGFPFGTPAAPTFDFTTAAPLIVSNQSNNTSSEIESLPNENEAKNHFWSAYSSQILGSSMISLLIFVLPSLIGANQLFKADNEHDISDAAFSRLGE